MFFKYKVRLVHDLPMKPIIKAVDIKTGIESKKRTKNLYKEWLVYFHTKNEQLKT